jgi:hypothetical protein
MRRARRRWYCEMRSTGIGRAEAMDSFEIGGSDELSIRFHTREIDRRGLDGFSVTVRAPHLEATVRVDDNPDFGLPVCDFFERLAASWQRWQESGDWIAANDELHLAATADASGHVTITAQLRGDFYQSWRTTAKVVVDAGPLESLARRARAFVDRAS